MASVLNSKYWLFSLSGSVYTLRTWLYAYRDKYSADVVCPNVKFFYCQTAGLDSVLHGGCRVWWVPSGDDMGRYMYKFWG